MKTWSILGALLTCSANVHAQSPWFDSTGPSEWVNSVVCITAGDEPWREIDQGTLRTWHQDGLTVHRLITRKGTAGYWTWEWHPDGVRAYGNYFLTDYVTRYVEVPSKYRFGPDRMPGTRLDYDIEPQSVSVNKSGEMTQRFGPFTIANVVGYECPKK